MTDICVPCTCQPEHHNQDVRDLRWMRAALAQARVAAVNSEVPVGAVVVYGDQIIGRGANASIQTHDPTAHAEIVALRDAARHTSNYRLEDCELFVTLEPCVMCAGAMLHARLKRVVFGALDPKTGSAGSVVNVFAIAAINHQTQVVGGILADECAHQLHEFFSNQRQRLAQEKVRSGGILRDDALRTQESRFDVLHDMPGPAFYVHDLPALNGLRLHYVDTGPLDADSAFVYLHGSADWSYVWRQRVVQARAQGQRVVCPDLIGFGRSDKPKKVSAHSLPWHALYMVQLFDRLSLKKVTLVVAPDMESFADEILLAASARITHINFQQPAALTTQALNAPYPDNGHRAALRAFSATVRHS